MCKLHRQITREFLGIRKRNFQVLLLHEHKYIESKFQICISVPLISILQLLLVQVEASTFWKTFWWQLLSMIPNKKLMFLEERCILIKDCKK